MAMQVLPVGGIYTAMEEEKRRAEEERIRKDMEEAAKRSGCCPSCGNIVSSLFLWVRRSFHLFVHHFLIDLEKLGYIKKCVGAILLPC